MTRDKKTFFLTAAIILAFFQLQVEAEAKRKNYVKTSIFFITDRNMKGDRFGPHRKYEVDCKHDPFMGRVFPVVLNEKAKDIDEDRRQLGWSAAKKPRKNRPFKKELVKGKKFSEIQEKFYADVLAAAEKNPTRELYVFVHGFKTKFEKAAQEAGELSYFAECPVLLYSWPSVGKLLSYDSDQENSEWSQDHFNRMIQQLTALRAKCPELKIHLIGYSMGTRLVVRSAPYLTENGVFTEYVLVCPDIDMGIFKHYLYKYATTNGHAAIRVYNSRKDKALVLSQMLHGGYLRFGEYTDSLFNQFMNWVGESEELENQGDPEMEKKIEETKKRIQTIEFTRVDKGFIGHKLPCELIVNMGKTDEPGPGLELVQAGEKTARTNRFGRFISWWTEVASRKGKVDDTCLYVYRTNQHSKNMAAKDGADIK